MIYCSALNIVFLKTKKVGGTSFEIAMSKYCSEKDIVTPITPEDEEVRDKLGYQNPVNYLTEQRCNELISQNVTGNFRNHMTSKEVYKNLGKDIFDKCTKISIHRDPLDFLVSLYFFQKRLPEFKDVSFSDWLPDNYRAAQGNYEIAPLSGPYAPDIILKYETLSDDIKQTKQLPRDFVDIFSSLNAKGHHRPSNTHEVKDFFRNHDCENYIPKIMKLTERRNHYIQKIKDRIHNFWV